MTTIDAFELQRAASKSTDVLNRCSTAMFYQRLLFPCSVSPRINKYEQLVSSSSSSSPLPRLYCDFLAFHYVSQTYIIHGRALSSPPAAVCPCGIRSTRLYILAFPTITIIRALRFYRVQYSPRPRT